MARRPSLPTFRHRHIGKARPAFGISGIVVFRIPLSNASGLSRTVAIGLASTDAFGPAVTVAVSQGSSLADSGFVAAHDRSGCRVARCP
jgi:hypothetical protein